MDVIYWKLANDIYSTSLNVLKSEYEFFPELIVGGTITKSDVVTVKVERVTFTAANDIVTCLTAPFPFVASKKEQQMGKSSKPNGLVPSLRSNN